MSKSVMSVEFNQALDAYLAKLQGDYDAQWGESSIAGRTKYAAQWGQKFIRIVSTHDGAAHSSHSFINKHNFTTSAKAGSKSFLAGDILMAASWNAPALNHARGNILDLDYGRTSAYGAGYMPGGGRPQ
jgi:hypothetical protein